jgi:hypothetical protein
VTWCICAILTVEGEPGVAEEEERFLGHIVDRSKANVFIDFYEHVDQVIPMEHHILDGTRGDGWHFWVAPGGVLLVTVREYGKTYHYPIAGVQRCIVLPQRGGDPTDPFAPAQPVCECDSEVIENVEKMEQELIVLDAGKGQLKAVFFHNAECLEHWKEEQGGATQAEGPGAGAGP